MKLILLNPFFPLIVAVVVSSCNQSECRNTNTVFNNFAPDTKEYKNELAEQINKLGGNNLSYRFDSYKVNGNKESILIDIQGSQLCAKGELLVTDWSKISGLRKKISGYRGAELKGLKIKITKDLSGINFTYENVDYVID